MGRTGVAVCGTKVGTTRRLRVWTQAHAPMPMASRRCVSIFLSEVRLLMKLTIVIQDECATLNTCSADPRILDPVTCSQAGMHLSVTVTSLTQAMPSLQGRVRTRTTRSLALACSRTRWTPPLALPTAPMASPSTPPVASTSSSCARCMPLMLLLVFFLFYSPL